MSKMFVLALVLILPTMIFAQETAAPDTAKQAVSAATQAPEVQAEEIPIETTLSVAAMAFCAGVEEREPAGEGSEFSTDVGTLFFWSNVLNSGEETTIDHVWYLNGDEKARVTLPAKYARNRIWSSKIIPAEWDGEWKVEIVSGGEVLGAKSCAVK